jgi:enterochelin esterase-like enzyme
MRNSQKSRISRANRIIVATCLFSLMYLMQGFSAKIEDRTHYSSVLGRIRNYRVFLPPDYYQSGKSYPVLYWFHGSGGSSKQDTYKKEFEEFVNNHDLIIVNVDGTTDSGTTWDYGLAFEFGNRTQEGNAALTGMYFSKYIRELIGVIDSEYRSIADRDHRAVSGQSMGGLMSPWIASQNKDLIGSASMFSPSPDAAMFGSPGSEVCFVNRELYRSLKGLPLRITVASGDRYRQYYHEQKAVWDLADLTHLEFNEANYPDHKAVDIPDQFEFHMSEFARFHPFPQNWHHADPFKHFEVWNYDINAIRDQSAFTNLEKVSLSGMLLCSRSFLPNGPLIQSEKITVTTDTIYSPSKDYVLTDFNRSTGSIRISRVQADSRGRLKFSADGGGHAIGVRTENQGAKLFLIPASDNEEIYCEEGKEHSLSFSLINVGTRASGPVHIKASTPKSFLTFNKDTLTLNNILPGERIKLNDQFPFIIKSQKYDIPDNENFITRVSLEVKCNDSVQDISSLFVYPVAKTPFITVPLDLIILDGTGKSVEYYNNRTHKIETSTISGGTGNGNLIPEPGETIELWVRLPQGLGPADKNTYHPSYLLNTYESPWISVRELKYNIKGAEYSGAANLQSRIRINPDTPPGTELSLWLKIESYEFSEEGFNRPVQRHNFDYRHVILRIDPVNKNVTGNIKKD